MAVIFPSWTNKLPHAIGVGLPVVALAAIAGVWYFFSPEFTDVGYRPKQPIAYSHKVHAGDLGLDCRFCHNTIERGFYAAVPPAETCMLCHTTVRKERPTLTPLRLAFKQDKPIKWVRVHMLPDYAFFNHRVHLAAGVGCISCHGRVDTMDVVEQKKSLSMGFCLDCHRNPTPNLRPVSQITNMRWDAKIANYDPKTDPHRKRTVEPPLHCSGCHR
ncbi:MAG: cytochrome c3 family protein [Myxococcales bacterium]|nr:cytochrome c3 family protein [Myxococcales bacterium]